MSITTLARIDPSNSQTLPILLVGYIMQGMGFMVAMCFIVVSQYRAIRYGFHRGASSATAFIAAGPPGYTALAVLRLGQYGRDILPRHTIIPQAGADAIFYTAIPTALVLLGVAIYFWFFALFPWLIGVRAHLYLNPAGSWPLTFPSSLKAGMVLTFGALGDALGAPAFWILQITFGGIIVFEFVVIFICWIYRLLKPADPKQKDVRDHQLWRLITRNLAFTNSVDLFVSVLLLYNASITLERRLGTVKFVSFALVSSFIGTTLEVVALTLGRRLGLDYLPAGPYTLVFSLLYHYDRCVPSSYVYKIFGFSFSSKSLLYLLSLALVFAQPPNSVISAACGIAAGALYRGNAFGCGQWRIPLFLQKAGSRLFMPLLETSRMPRRSTRTSLEDSEGSSQAIQQTPTNPRAAATARQGAISEVVQTFAGTRAASAPAPPAEAVSQLQAMFPQASAEQINSALQRGGNDVNRSVEFLL
ncbi:MAG: hypothetical protein CYPHOPRED_003281 [Cyphobasidiales sp. Tagirdzhanova-0007]|nr:MAG: hypothetical protein CYPHOPRED_003281 [Cyphobasidiales sp. Tagirdzhanova-0007]